jgi:uncharacterized repeat protein (TIGR01451 family)
MKTAAIFGLVLLIILVAASSASAKVFINEVQLNTSGETYQWIELYNARNEDVNVTGWSIVPLRYPYKEKVVDYFAVYSGDPLAPVVGDKIIPPKGFFVLVPAEEDWMDPYDETLILKNFSLVEVDRTPALTGHSYTGCSWSRYPDGSSYWNFMRSTMCGPNSGEVCTETIYSADRLKFDVVGKVTGSGFVRTRTTIKSGYAGLLKSSEHGSGTYETEGSTDCITDFIEGTHTTGMTKSDHSARYGGSTLNVTPTRSISFDSRWTGSSMVARTGRNPQYIYESIRYAERIDSDLLIRSEGSSLKAKIGSEFNGSGRIGSSLANYASSEEHTGSFRVYKNIREEDSRKIESSVSGDGFVRSDTNIGGKVATYERGTGGYEVDELIDTSGTTLAKDVKLSYNPTSYTYAPDRTINRSMLWREGTRVGEKGFSFIGTEFSNIKRLEEDMVVTSIGGVKTSANFSGKARLQTALIVDSGDNPGMVYMDEEYEGDYSIERKMAIMPIYQTPHISIASEGRLDQPGCDRLRYVITIINDGNLDLGPVYVRNTFPAGTRFVDASLQPLDLGSRYANWSISRLGTASSVTIEFELQITARRDSYTNRVRAQTVYQSEDRRGRVRERKLRASDTSVLEADWTGCVPQNISATYTASSDPLQPNLLNYRLTVQNLAKEDMRFDITASLPKGVKFISSASPTSEIRGDEISWTIDRLAPGRRRTISFTAEAELDGLLASVANVQGRSLDGRELGSANAGATVLVGDFADLARPESQDWLPCSEEILPRDYWIRAASSTKALSCC